VAPAPTTPYQPSLLASGPPEVGRPLAEAARTDLGRGAWVDSLPGWVAGGDALFDELRTTVAWRHREVPMYGRVVAEPRLTAWWADDEDGATALGRAPQALRDLLPRLAAHYDQPFDCIGLNLYRDGRDSVAWHGDRTERGRPVTTVAVLSLGSPRRFLLRPSGGGPSRCTEMFSGDLLVMGGTCQHTWQHSIPKVARAGPRLSVTFRHRLPRGEARPPVG
jgi:alkylated DNA repair dioxygenase AlkB